MKFQFPIQSGAGFLRSWDASVESPVDESNNSWSPGALHPALMRGYGGIETEGWHRLDDGMDFSFDGNDRGGGNDGSIISGVASYSWIWGPEGREGVRSAGCAGTRPRDAVGAGYEGAVGGKYLSR